VDGARIFNAAIALGIEAQELVQNADSITFCLSKGLSCPVGSVLCGSKDFIDEARRWRRMLGGGMRQAGVIAAAGVVGLEQMIDRLALDHATAKNLAYKISEIPGVIIDPSSIQTNIVIFEIDRGVSPASDVVNALKSKGVKVSTYGSIVPNGGQYIRMVTHRHIGEEDVDSAAMALSEVMASLS
jgi:threonine aldolase